MQKAIVSQNMANPSMFPLLHHILNTTMGIVNWLNYHFLSTAVQAYHIKPKIAYQITMDVHKGFYPPQILHMHVWIFVDEDTVWSQTNLSTHRSTRYRKI